MKKILFLIDSLAGGGAERALVNLVESMDKNSYDITVQTIYDIGIYKDKLDKRIKYKTCGLPVIRGMNYLFKFIPAKILHKFLIKDNYDLEIAFLEGISTKIISGAPLDVPKIGWVRIDIAQHPKSTVCYFSKNAMLKAYKKFTKIAFVGEDSRKSFVDVTGIKDNLYVVRNVVKNDEMIHMSEESVNIEHKFHPILLSVGRLEPQKGYDRLCKVHKRLIQEGYNYTLVIMGKGSQKDQIIQFIKENHLEDSLILLDFQKNPYKYMRYCDWFVSSSRYEGFSSVIREAIILEKPIIATDCSGVREVLGNDEYGIVAENSEIGLYNSIKYVLDNNYKLQQHYTEKSKIRKRIFDYKLSVEKNLDFILSVLS